MHNSATADNAAAPQAEACGPRRRSSIELNIEAVGLRHVMGATSAPRSHRAHAQVDLRSVSFWAGFWMGIADLPESK